MKTDYVVLLWIVCCVEYTSNTILMNCTKPVERCPNEKDQWILKTVDMMCESKKGYVCLQGPGGQLFESCMSNFTIQSNSRNCPKISSCKGNEPVLGLDTSYSPCPVDIKGCPPANHTKYSILDLYIYPKCLESNLSTGASTRLTSTSPSSTTNRGFDKETTPTHTLSSTIILSQIIVFVNVFLVLVGISAAYLFCSRRGKTCYSHERTNEGNMNEDKNTEKHRLLGYKKDEELRELQTAIRNVNKAEANRIKILPLENHKNIDINKFFVPVSIVDEYEIQTTKTNGKDNANTFSLDKMLYVEPGREARFVFMIGEAGYGKTIQCQWLSNLWCNVWDDEVSPEEAISPYSESQEVLRNYDFLFFVQMRDLNSDDVFLIDMIADTYSRYHTSITKSNIRYVIEQEQYKCLILLDGLDEWKISEERKKTLKDKGIPNCRDIKNCTVLITMRSWKLMEVEHICRHGTFDKVLRLQGLDDDGVKTITSNILRHHYGLKEDTSDEFKSKYQSITEAAFSATSKFKSLMKIPLLAIFCILTLCKNIDSCYSLTTLYLSMVETLIRRTEGIRNERAGPSDASVLQRYPYVCSSISRLSSLGRLAFEGLISQNSTLVFNEEDLERELGRETLDLFLNVGLLNTRHVAGRIHLKKIKVSFLHKTLQDFLSSLYLFKEKSISENKKLIHNMVCDIEKALELSTMLAFSAGLSPQLGCHVSNHLKDLTSRDEDILSFRNHFAYGIYQKMFLLYDLQLTCYREMRGMKTMEETLEEGMSFTFSDIFLHANDTDTMTVRESADILRHHANDIQSLCMVCIPDDSKEGITNAELKDFFDRSKSIRSVYIDGYIKGKCRLFDSLSEHITNLCTLSLWNVAFRGNALTNFLSKEKSRKSIEALGLFYIRSAKDLGVDFEYNFASVHKLFEVRYGYLKCPHSYPAICDKLPILGGILEVLPNYTNLSVFFISYLESNSDREMLLKVLPELTNLRNIGYLGSSIYSEPNQSYDTQVFNIILRMKQLQALFLGQMELLERSLILESVSDLEFLWLEMIHMEPRGWKEFAESLSSIKALSKIVLSDTTIDKSSQEIIEESASFKLVRGECNAWLEFQKDGSVLYRREDS